MLCRRRSLALRRNRESHARRLLDMLREFFGSISCDRAGAFSSHNHR